MRRREFSIEEAACDSIEKELFITSIKLNITGRIGFPDRLFFIPGGRPLVIEFKREGEPPRPIQAYVLEGLRELGYDVAVADNVPSAFQAVQAAVRASGKDPRRSPSRRAAATKK